jgi:hypothetical protein
MAKLADFFSINRRFTRSINLERDFDSESALQGYILTDRAIEVLEHILIDSAESDTVSGTTITSVYGTGKSAFANFLLSLCASAGNPARQIALDIAKRSLGSENYGSLIENLPELGFFRAIATAQREPLCRGIVKAINFGLSHSSGIPKKLSGLISKMNKLEEITNSDALTLIREVLANLDRPVILVIDELGKSIEYAALHQRNEDLYLLQQIAELPLVHGKSFNLIGLLHQSFADYGQGLVTSQRNEWAKIQGRFRDFAFSSQPREMTKLIGQAIFKKLPEKDTKKINEWARKWHKALTKYGITDISSELIAEVYPLHPVAALVLPVLCSSYAQNDRSLFSFLSSNEALSFTSYLRETEFFGSLSTLKLDIIYDYFVGAISGGFGSRPDLHKWVEIHNLISSLEDRATEVELNLVKTIGVLNLVDSFVEFKAKLELVKLACVEAPDQVVTIETAITSIRSRGILNERRDELRLWEGTDFNISAELNYLVETERASLAYILNQSYLIKPTIAQRHSYCTGTVRYFESTFIDSSFPMEKLKCSSPAYDGLVAYWVDVNPLVKCPTSCNDGKPVIVISTDDISPLRSIALEYFALKKLLDRAELSSDRVARCEVEYRLRQAELQISLVFSEKFKLSQSKCWVLGKSTEVAGDKQFNSVLSLVCDEIYNQTPILRNELINRRELTGQAIKALRVLLKALLENSELERLGLVGYGPETSIYESVLHLTGIHRQENGIWGIHPPIRDIVPVWSAIVDFCKSASEQSQSLSILYDRLESPPYGMKRGLIPLLLATVLVYYNDEVSIYKDGVFIPVLGDHHFELLVRNPQSFSVRYFEIIGVRSQVFHELEGILRTPTQKPLDTKIRNRTILSVVKPLLQFSKSLPVYTKKTASISTSAQQVVSALDRAQEPDDLIFQSLPVACGLEPISMDKDNGGNTASEYRKRLVKALHDIQSAYDNLLNRCYGLLHEAFGVSSDISALREDLRVRSGYLKDSCLEKVMKRFILAAIDQSSDDRVWLESLLMIVADKPPKVWSDEDVSVFEIKLSDLARRFANLEALQKDVETRKYKGFDALRMTITRVNGREIHRLVWVEPDQEGCLDKMAEDILNNTLFQGKRGNRLQQALLAKLAEKIFDEEVNLGKQFEKAKKISRNQAT